MEEKPTILIDKENRYPKTVVQENKTTGIDLSMQIFPLLNDFFCGTFEKNTQGVLIRLENGQLFQLSVTEVAL